MPLIRKKLNANLSRRISLVLLVLLAVGGGGVLQASDWRLEIIDPASAGSFSSLRADHDGNLHLGYFDQAQNILKYAFWDRKMRKWFNSSIDRSRGFCSLALDSKQQPHISYLALGDGQLKYAHWDGSSWHKEVIQVKAKDISYYTSIVLDTDDNPIISYYEYQGMGEDYSLQLRDVEWKGKYWGNRTIDRTPGSGKFNVMATDPAGNRHVAYANVKDENASLRYAHWTGTAWVPEILEGAGPANFPVFSVSIALDQNNQPHITYTDVRHRLVKYAARKDQGWQLQVVDSIADFAYPDRNGIALDDQGRPYISYYDAGAGILKLAHRLNGKWVTEIVDDNSAGFTSSLQIDRGTIFMTYTDQISGILKFAYRPLDDNVSARVLSSASSTKE